MYRITQQIARIYFCSSPVNSYEIIKCSSHQPSNKELRDYKGTCSVRQMQEHATTVKVRSILQGTAPRKNCHRPQAHGKQHRVSPCKGKHTPINTHNGKAGTDMRHTAVTTLTHKGIIPPLAGLDHRTDQDRVPPHGTGTLGTNPFLLDASHQVEDGMVSGHRNTLSTIVISPTNLFGTMHRINK